MDVIVEEDVTLERRTILKGLLTAGVLTTIPGTALAGRMDLPHYKVSMVSSHTGEKFSGVYRIGNRYLPDAFEKITHFMRDFRTGDLHTIDPRVIDILASLQVRCGQKGPLEVLSGYRSPKTNAMLRRASTGVAKNSYHLKGRAVDFRIPGYSTARIRNKALDLAVGGVGYYPGSNFVHVDTGDVRSW
ncbi:MAG: DUF882 domain-containing protein [Rhodospirillales bacterium]|nr:DUF882 domain-containing protein [Rhodospirillales bacterium]MCB9980298.1 DUF882 domain-containing protein [Rhodospirillales bacterium]